MRIVLNYSFGFGQYWDFEEALYYCAKYSVRMIELGAPVEGGSNIYNDTLED